MCVLYYTVQLNYVTFCRFMGACKPGFGFRSFIRINLSICSKTNLFCLLILIRLETKSDPIEQIVPYNFICVKIVKTFFLPFKYKVGSESGNVYLNLYLDPHTDENIDSSLWIKNIIVHYFSLLSNNYFSSLFITPVLLFIPVL